MDIDLQDGYVDDCISTGYNQYIWTAVNHPALPLTQYFKLQKLNEYGFVIAESLPVSREIMRYIIPSQKDWGDDVFERILCLQDMDIESIKVCIALE